MRGHERFKDGSWRLIVDAGKDPITGKRRQFFRTVRAPNTRAGAQAAHVELAPLVLEVASGEAAPSAQITVGELLVRWVEHRRRAWEARSPGQPDWTLSVIANTSSPGSATSSSGSCAQSTSTTCTPARDQAAAASLADRLSPDLGG